jgi:hypothetical protein
MKRRFYASTVTMQATSVVFVGHARFGATLRDAMALSHGTAHPSTAMILGPATFGTFFLQGRSESHV